jgi:adenylate cyclase class 2
MLDEVPYGCFTEVEGPDLEMIQSTCTQLHLNWEARIQYTYMDMFQALSDGMEPKPTDATFEAFAEHPGVDATLLSLPSGYLSSNEEAHQA